jgi:hypothetical protein
MEAIRVDSSGPPIPLRGTSELGQAAAAPLIAGNDLRNMSQSTRDILTAPEVIAVNQDALGIQGTLVSGAGSSGLEVWSKTLSGLNTRGVMFLNRSEEAANIIVYWSDIGSPLGPAIVRMCGNGWIEACSTTPTMRMCLRMEWCWSRSSPPVTLPPRQFLSS